MNVFRDLSFSMTRNVVITINADPMHLAAIQALLFTNNRSVILRLTGRDTRITTNTGAQVDDHSPLVALRIDVVVGIAVHGELMTELVMILRKTRIILVPFNGGTPNMVAPLHLVMVLQQSQLVLSPHPLELAQLCDIQASTGADLIKIKANIITHVTGAATSPTQVHGYGAIGMTRLDQHSGLGLKFTNFQADIASARNGVGSIIRAISTGFHFLGGCRTHEDHGVPHQGRYRLRQLLQPRIVGVTAVVHTGVRQIGNLNAVRIDFGHIGIQGRGIGFHRLRRKGAPGQHTVMYHFAPAGLRVITYQTFPSLTNQLVNVLIRLTRNEGNNV